VNGEAALLFFQTLLTTPLWTGTRKRYREQKDISLASAKSEINTERRGKKFVLEFSAKLTRNPRSETSVYCFGFGSTPSIFRMIRSAH
jgi:hypothetical protein